MLWYQYKAWAAIEICSKIFEYIWERDHWFYSVPSNIHFCNTKLALICMFCIVGMSISSMCSVSEKWSVSNQSNRNIIGVSYDCKKYVLQFCSLRFRMEIDVWCFTFDPFSTERNNDVFGLDFYERTNSNKCALLTCHSSNCINIHILLHVCVVNGNWRWHNQTWGINCCASHSIWKELFVRVVNYANERRCDMGCRDRNKINVNSPMMTLSVKS